VLNHRADVLLSFLTGGAPHIAPFRAVHCVNTINSSCIQVLEYLLESLAASVLRQSPFSLAYQPAGLLVSLHPTALHAAFPSLCTSKSLSLDVTLHDLDTVTGALDLLASNSDRSSQHIVPPTAQMDCQRPSVGGMRIIASHAATLIPCSAEGRFGRGAC
jgi:hypothetical protein